MQSRLGFSDFINMEEAILHTDMMGIGGLEKRGRDLLSGIASGQISFIEQI